ncbi:MAG: zinc ribbon domain-containing protein [Ktedonobacteraceae bacterium]|nr:zinc ribbon domain-containing protein [Ktedonobacteraceae bacterium]
MNFWESVHRGFEKASQEAARIARTQKLRFTIDGLNRQIAAQQNMLVGQAMELFTSGRLGQQELLPICQELVNLQQQLSQAQSELTLVQQGQISSAPSVSPAGEATPQFPTIPASPPPPISGGSSYTQNADAAIPPYAPPPDYTPYGQTTPAPPPPPGVAPAPATISSMETMHMGQDTPPPPPPPFEAAALLCPRCQALIQPGIAYCPNCGLPIQHDESTHLPTVRGSATGEVSLSGQETILASEPAPVTPAQGEAARPEPVTGGEQKQQFKSSNPGNTPSSQQNSDRTDNEGGI